MGLLKRAKARKGVLLLAAAVIVLLFFCVRCGAGRNSEAVSENPVDRGIAYLESMESIGAENVEAQVKAIREAEFQAMRDERLRQLESGEVSVWSLFEDYVILGDSRTCGLMFHNYLDNSRILAAYGDTVKAIEGHISELERINPGNIFLCYGLNDVVQTGWETPEAYAADYKLILDDLQSRFPEARIFVNSIFQCYEPAFTQRWEKWRETPEYSAAVQKMCEEAGYYFIENENLDDSMSHLWQDDGIHFLTPFYPIWATNMIMEVYDVDVQQSEAPAA